MRNKLFVSKFIASVCLIYFVAGCTDDVIENTISFPSDNQYARHFSIEYNEDNTVLKIIDPWIGAKDIHYNYNLIDGYTLNKSERDKLNNISVPVKRVICMSTTHIAYISELNEIKSIKGVSGKNFVYNSEVYKNPEIKDIGYDTGINYELIIDINPELILLYGVGSEITGLSKKLNDMGFKTLIIAEYLESTALGKAEWIKVFGALFNKPEAADSIFQYINSEYNNLKKLVSKKKIKPKVFMGSPWNEIWHVSGGNTNLPLIISDAGGDYIWKNDTSSKVYPMDIESVLMNVNDADFWLNIGSLNSKEEILYSDSRLSNLKAYRQGNLYNNNNRVNNSGGNDFYESGAVNPHLILKDMIYIFYPELIPYHELYYYKKF